VMMVIKSLNEKAINFKSLEKEIFKKYCKAACEEYRELLEAVDEIILKTRDKGRNRVKNKRYGTIRTIMGEVRYKRRYYQTIDEDGVIEYKYLLDEILGIEGKRTVSAGAIESIIETATKMSYRKSAETLEKNTNLNVSHQTVWSISQIAGKKVKEHEKRTMESYEKGETKGKKEVEVLFEEKDGVYLSIQKEKNKKEIKVAKIYEGWEKKSPGSKEYATRNRMYVVGFEDGEKFDYRINSIIAKEYNIEKLKKKIVNADGAKWAKQESEMDANIIHQLDPFHIHQAIMRKVKDKKEAGILRKYINANKLEEFFKKLNEMIEKEEEEKEEKKLKELKKYIRENKKHITRYKERGHTLPSLPEGLEYRGMGTIEGSQHNVICDRMKNRGMSWSEKGAENMAKLLALRFSGKLFEVMDSLTGQKLEESDWCFEDFRKKSEEKDKDILRKQQSAMRSMKLNIDTKQSNGCHESSLPYEGSKMTWARKALREYMRGKKYV